MTILWVLLTGVIGFALGYWACSVATWVKVHRLEGELRNFSLDIQVMLDMDDELPPEWVKQRVDYILEKEFR